ncbi:MAG: potassium transporter TrkG [Rhizobiaceae bacterium]|nr:potassium transporter TrkG [Rhizobiaceae bacterium]
MTTVVFYLAALASILSASLLLPALVAFGLEETAIGYRMLMYSVSGGFVSIAILLTILGKTGGLERNNAILLTVGSWIFFPSIMTLPIADLSGIGYTDAFFQSVSGFTTTGALIYENPDKIPTSVLFMLAQLQWLGGLATLVTLILVLAPWEIGGLPQVASASVAASIVASQSRLVAFCGRIFRIYFTITAACFVLLILAGVSPLNAAIFAYTSVSTGGIVPVSGSVDELLGGNGMIIVSLFLLAGATSIFWLQDLFRLDIRKLLQHRESYFMIAGVGVISLYIAYVLISAAGSSTILPVNRAVSEGVLNATSLISTSALQSRPGVFALLPPTLVLLLVFVGGGCYSTSGGIKFFRIGGMYSLARNELDRLLYPSVVRPRKFGNTEFNLDFMKAVWSLFAILVATLGVITCMLSFSGLSFQPAFTAAMAAISNAGPLYGEFWDFSASGEWPAYHALLESQKVILSLGMILGRLEVIAVFAAITVLLRSIR